MLLDIETPIYYAVDFMENSASIKTYETLPKHGHVIEISPREDNRGNGYYPVRLFVDGSLTSWKTDYLEVVKMHIAYNWSDVTVSFDIKDKRGSEVTIIGSHSRFNIEEGIVSLMQKWAWCRKFHFTHTIKVYKDYSTFLYLVKSYKADKWISENLFISFKRDLMKIDEYIKSTILSCLECGYNTDIEDMQEVRNELKKQLWDFQLEPKENK